VPCDRDGGDDSQRRPEEPMTITLRPETQARFIVSIKRFFSETLDDDIGDLKASLLLEFVLREIGPSIYNRAVADAQARIQEMASELDGSCFEADVGYWNKK
jgi:uncharacterized protein (DUF2164 family)